MLVSILPRKEFQKDYLASFCLIHGSLSSSPILFKRYQAVVTVTALCGRDPHPKKLEAFKPSYCHTFWPHRVFKYYPSSACTCTMNFRRKTYTAFTTDCLTLYGKLRNCLSISRLYRYIKANGTVYWINDALQSYHSKDMVPKKTKDTWQATMVAHHIKPEA